jgi:hypothetical protein
MRDTMSVPKNTNDRQLSPEQADRLIRAIERIERRFDEFFGSFLNSAFPYGKPTDRWRRRG